MERKEIKEQEIKFLLQENKKNPELFKREEIIDDIPFLEKIGVFFAEEQKENISNGYLKIWPHDFIVEETSKDGLVETVDIDEFFDRDKDFSNEDLTIYATLVKCMTSTFEAVEEISKTLGIDKKNIQFAGIKDKDALTSQLISIRGADIERVKEISSPYFFLKNIYSGKGAVEVGSLKGNKFTILVRTDKSFNEKHFLKNLEEIKENGFFNFFYSQRFGSPRFINWFWGLLILRGEYRNAVLSFLSSEGEREVGYFKNIRKEIKENFGKWDKVEEILKPFPLILQNETRVVKYLKKHPSDFIGALSQIPEQIQLWTFAYGSLLFNRKISECIRENKEVPERLPLILSKDKNDWIEYYDFLKEDGISTLPLNNLKPFPHIQWKKRLIKTKETVQIHNIKVIPEGVILSFSLPKACYATTFLSHLFYLISAAPNEKIQDNTIDLKKELGEEDIQDVLERFKDISHSKTQNIFTKEE